MSQSRSPPTLEERLARLEARLASKQAAVQTAHENVASARIGLNDIHSDPDVREAVVEHALAERALERAQRKLDTKTRELETAKARVRRRIQRDLDDKERALEVASQELEHVRTSLEAARQEKESQASNQRKLLEDERFAHDLALAESDALSQEDIYALLVQRPTIRA